MEKKIIYVTSDNNEPYEIRYGLGTPENRRKPFFHEVMRTIEHEYVHGLGRDFEVRLAPGTYYMKSPFTVGGQSGTPTLNAHVTFVADGGEVILSGGKVIEGFTETTVNGVCALVADIPAVRLGEWDFEELYVNKALRKRPVLPADGSRFQVTGIPSHPVVENVGQANPAAFSSTDMLAFEAKDGAFDGIAHPEETIVHMTHFWVHERIPVTHYDKERKLVHFTVRPNQPFVDSTNPRYSFYHIENVFEALKSPGQWYLDRIEGKLYYIPLEGETKDNILVEAPYLYRLVDIKGKAGDPMSNVTFRGITFECTKSGHEHGPVPTAYEGAAAGTRRGVVNLEYTSDITFEHCHFRNTGNYAIYGEHGGTNIAVERCTFRNLGSGAIALHGDESDALRGVSIENCLVSHVGLVYPESTAVHIGGSHVRIAHNEICYTGYSGVIFSPGGGHYYGTNCFAVIEYNHIHHCGDGYLSDLAGFYVYGNSMGLVIRGNYIHDVCRGVYGGNGIYLDEDACHALVEKNVVHDCASGCFMVHFGKENVIRHNIFGHGEACVSLGAQSRNDERRKSIYFNIFKNIYFVEDNAVYQGLYNVTLTEPIMEAEANFIYKTTDAPLYNLNKTKVKELGVIRHEWDEWTAQGMDVFSQVYSCTQMPLSTPAELKKYGFPDVSAEYAGILPEN